MNRVLSRGLYIGGRTHVVLDMAVNDEEALARAYHEEWVVGGGGNPRVVGAECS